MEGVGSNDDMEYPGNLTAYVIVTCAIAAMGGLVFGYDIGITGGVTSMDAFLKIFFPNIYHRELDDNHSTMYCKFNSHTLTLFTSSLFLAASLSTIVASMVTRKLGRKCSMVIGGVLFCVGALITCLALNVWMLIVGRVVLGFGVGFVNQCVPLYLSEMAPHKYRGALNIGFQLSITIGILVANLFNYGISRVEVTWGWRLSLGVTLVPALMFTIGSLFLLDTPTSMVERGKVDEARAQLKRIRGIDIVDQEFDDLVAANETSKKVEHPWRDLLQRKYRHHVAMAIAIPFFQQFSGINAVIFYAPTLFQSIGYEVNPSLESAVITGGVNLLATTISIYTVDRWGRRFLFLEGGIQMFLSQIAFAICMGVNGERQSSFPKWYANMVVVFICIYVSGFAWSWGPLGWLIPSEIFPLEIRSAALSLSVFINMISIFVVAQLFLTMLCHLKFGLFLFFAFFVLVMTTYIYFFLPETKNVPIEEMVIIFPPERRRFYYVERALRMVQVQGRG